jgi:glycosyltransferase involved in cell wall biosynthesis
MARRSILFIAPHPIEGPSTRFRVCQFLPALEAAGYTCELRPFLSSRLAPLAYGPGLASKVGVTAWGFAKRVTDIARASGADLVYVLREAFPIGPGVFERLMGAACGNLVFDFDDAIWAPATNFDNPLDRLRDWSRPANVIRNARRTVVGSEYLAKYARRHAQDPARVVVIPTVVDTARFSPRPRAHSAECVIGWIGTPRNTVYVQSIWPCLLEAWRLARRLRFVFVGAEPFDVGEAPVRFERWRLSDEVAAVQNFDIGIMPLPDDEQTRGKCGFKIIQYMACGIPAIASPVGANCEVLRDGETGFLANSPQQWIGALLNLVADPALRERMGVAGRERAVSRYSLAAMTGRFVETIESAAEKKGERRHERTTPLA